MGQTGPDQLPFRVLFVGSTEQLCVLVMNSLKKIFRDSRPVSSVLTTPFGFELHALRILSASQDRKQGRFADVADSLDGSDL